MSDNQSLNNLAYAHICRMLVEDRLSPDQRLSEQVLAKEIGISRTPVREAIRRLQNEGILYQKPSSGTYVVSPSPDDIQKLYEVREALECFLAQKAVPLMNRLDYQRIREQYKEMRTAVNEMRTAGAPFLSGEPLGRFLKADWAFHRYLLEPSDNQYALKILDDAQLKACVYGTRSHRRTEEHLARVLYTHKRILGAAIKGNASATAYWLRTHIRESRRDAIAALRDISAVTREAFSAPGSVYSAVVEPGSDTGDKTRKS